MFDEIMYRKKKPPVYCTVCELHYCVSFSSVYVQLKKKGYLELEY